MAHVKPMYLIVGLLSVALVNCGGGEATPEPAAPEQPADMGPPPPSEPPAAAPAEGAGGETPAAAPAEAAAPKPEPLTDEQILAVADAANATEIEQAKVGQKKAKNDKVKKLAGTIVADHNSAKGKVTKLTAKLKLKPADSSLASTLKSDSTSTIEKLNAATGADFDKAFVDSQVDGNKKLLDAIDSQLVPNAKNEELKKLLEEIRPKVEAHLKEAQDVQTALAAAPPPEEKPAKKEGAAKEAAPKDAGKAPAKK
jgi:putative membrane protein